MYSEDSFKQAVAEYIDYDHTTGKYDESKAEKIARRFSASKSTIERWAKGSTSPHPIIGEVVVKYILDETFKQTVGEYIEYDSTSGAYNEGKKRELADEFECIPGTVVRWASGASNPHPGIKALIIKYIRSKI